MKNVKYKIRILMITMMLLCFIATAISLQIIKLDDTNLEYTFSSGRLLLASGDFKEKVNDSSDVVNVIGKIKEYGFTNATAELKLLRINNSAAGKIYRYQQMHDGYEVFGRHLIVTVDKRGNILSVSGNYLKNIEIQGRPAITAQSAIETAQSEFGSVFTNASLTVYSIDCLPTLCYSVISTEGKGNRVFINAINSSIIAVLPLSANDYTLSESTNSIQYDNFGNAVEVPIEKNLDNNKYILADATRNIYILNANGAEDYSGSIYASESGKFDDGAAISAYRYLLNSYDFYADGNNLGIHGGYFGADNSHDNIHNNAAIKRELTINAYMHYSYAYNNAAYVNGLKNLDDRTAVMIFGDGDGVNYGNFATAPDIIGHEYQHIITEYTAGLIYLNASGALNEAISDIFGALIEGKDLTNEDFWLCGEIISRNNKAFRDLKNPESLMNPSKLNSYYFKSFCYLEHDHYNSNCDNGGVHTNSTLISHAAYKMYESMPNYFTKNVMGMLWFDTLQLCAPQTDFEEFNILMQQSAKNLGLSAEAQQAIADAFISVGITATDDTHTVSIETKNGFHQIKGKYGDKFVMPELESSLEGYDVMYWRGNRYSDRYYAGQIYEIPAYDIFLFANHTPKLWNNIKLTKFHGSGTFYDPYLIRSAEDLASLAHYVNTENKEYCEFKSYKLTADIDLLNIPWIPIGLTESSQFNCNFDGNGHVIKNLNISGAYSSYCGLFGVFIGLLENLGIVSGSTQTDASNLGAFVGLLKGKINKCYNQSDVKYSGTQTINYTGGIAGLIWNGRVNACYNTGNIEGNIAGGIFGRFTSTGVNLDGLILPDAMGFGNNYNTGNITGIIAGGIAGSAANTYLVNCLNTGTVAGTDSENNTVTIGGIAGKLNFPDSAIYADKYDASENAGMLGCRNVGVIDYSYADIYGALAGVLHDSATTGVTVSEKNVYRSQNGLNPYGNKINSTDKIFGDEPIESSDNLFEADFAFDDRDYFHDFTKWGVFYDISIFDSNAEWQFEIGKMPVHKKQEFWLDSPASSFAGGNGEKNSPYLIGTPEQLARLAYLINVSEDRETYNHAYYKLIDDIDLKGKIWTGIGGAYFSITDFGYLSSYYIVFEGNINGNGHTISNMSARETSIRIPPLNPSYKYSKIDTSAAFISAVYNNFSNEITISDINFDCVNNIGLQNAGGVVAIAHGINLTISNCSVNSGVIASESVAGGIVGYVHMNVYSDLLQLSIKSSLNSATVSGRCVGGILGYTTFDRDYGKNTITIDSCVNRGAINVFDEGNYYTPPVAGGLIGQCYTNLIIKNSINIGQLVNYDSKAIIGGFIGRVQTNIDKSVLNIKISASKQVGIWKNYGWLLNYGAAVGMLNNVAQNHKINLVIKKCIFKDGVIFSNINNVTGNVNFSITDIGNITDAGDVGSERFSFNDIEYFFNEDYWDTIDPETANNLYEFLGNTRINNAVILKNEDGSIFWQGHVRYRCTVDAIPVKEMTEKYVYVFTGWDVDITAITKETIATATFAEELRKYKVVFMDATGREYSTQYIPYGETAIPPAIPPEKSSYKFISWDYEGVIHSDKIINPIYEKIDVTNQSQLYLLFIPGIVVLLFITLLSIVLIKKRRKL